MSNLGMMEFVITSSIKLTAKHQIKFTISTVTANFHQTIWAVLKTRSKGGVNTKETSEMVIGQLVGSQDIFCENHTNNIEGAIRNLKVTLVDCSENCLWIDGF